MEIDYEMLKFKAGLEVHQQLDTSKLFCSCPSVLRSDDCNFKIRRKLHAVKGEAGEVDVAVLHQVSNDKEFIYEGYDTTCLVELDEEPPHSINKEALRIATEISLLLNCKMIPVTQVMRKMVVDGSNTSGFQRTVMIARGGYIETTQGRVGINFVLLEEDSARVISRSKKEVVYRLDRLGIPLVEIVTAPDVKNSEHAKEVALLIGDILRSTKVRRGIGTIRQDVNISIRGENRVEIKGMQDMKIFLDVMENEILRQKELSDKGNPTQMEVRDALPNGGTKFLRPMPGSSRMYPETDVELLHIKRDFVNEVKKNLPKLRSEIEADLKKKGVSEEIIKLLFKNNCVRNFEELVLTGASVKLVSKLLVLLPKEISKKQGKTLGEVKEILNLETIKFVLDILRKGKIQEGDLKIVLGKIVSGIPLKEAVKLDKADLVELEEKIKKLIKEKPGLRANAYMGLVMKEFGGQVDGGELMKIISGLLNSL